MPRIVIAAGEASGDQLGAGLIRAAQRLRADVSFAGVAGPAMREAGCEPWFRSEELSVMGLVEVLRHLPRLARIRWRLTRQLLRESPAAFVGVDSPDFNLRIAADARAAGIPAVQYVCPSVWAWRSSRVRLLRRSCNRVLCLLPFEEPFLSRTGIPATFVGHPFADEIPEAADPRPARRELALPAGVVIALLPGSRMAEITRLGPVFAMTAALLRPRLGQVSFVAPMATSDIGRAFAEQLRRHAPDCDVRLLDGRARVALAACDVALIASGTATLEAMLINRPMVVAYRLAPATYALVKAFRIVKVPHFSLPNLLAGEDLVPEFLQGEATPERLATALGDWLASPDGRQALRERFSGLHRGLQRDASVAAARAVLESARLL
jgi:lipid-A-disaccharide synthase